jgi:hypothetical protein
MSEDIVIVHVPPLVAILSFREKAKGAPLTQSEVLAVRDQAPCMALPRQEATQLAAGRGYDDIDPENAWEEWQAVRLTLNS